MSAKASKAAPKAKTTKLYDINTMAPDSLTMATTVGNNEMLRSWLSRVDLYVKAMKDLDRAVIVEIDTDSSQLLFSSVAEEV